MNSNRDHWDSKVGAEMASAASIASLSSAVETAIVRREAVGARRGLEEVLRVNKPALIALLKNPVRHSTSFKISIRLTVIMIFYISTVSRVYSDTVKQRPALTETLFCFPALSLKKIEPVSVYLSLGESVFSFIGFF